MGEARQTAFLKRLYQRAEGSTFNPVLLRDVEGDLGLSADEARRLVETLLHERLITLEVPGRIAMTSEGLKRAEATRRGGPELRLFLSYSHQDRKLHDRAKVHLEPLRRAGKVEIWDDTGLAPGSHWRDEIRRAIARADVAVLLVSADFLGSEVIASDELPPLLAAERARGLVILWLLVKPCLWAPRIPVLAEIQAVNDPKRPLAKMRASERDDVFMELARRVEALASQGPRRRS